MFADWELPTQHCMLTAVYKGIRRMHGKALTIGILDARKTRGAESVESRTKRIGLTVSYSRVEHPKSGLTESAKER